MTMRGTLCFYVIRLAVLAATTTRVKAFTVCYDAAAGYNVTAAYQQNVGSLLLALRPNASLTGFAAMAVGQPPDRVYGTAICFGDASRKDCRSCIYGVSATEEMNARCKSRLIWQDYCAVRYSSSNFIGILDTEEEFTLINNEQAPSDPALFNQRLVMLLGNLSAIATGNQSRLMYATGDTALTGQTIDGLVQCTRDISLDDCRTCLANLTSRIQTCCNNVTRVAVIISSRTCFIRFLVPQLSSSISASK